MTPTDLARKIVLDWNESRNWHVDLKHDDLIDSIVIAICHAQAEARREALEEAIEVMVQKTRPGSDSTTNSQGNPRAGREGGEGMSETKIERLRRLDKAAAKGPWCGRDPWLSVPGERLTNMVDRDLICAMRNALPALLAVVDAAKHYFQEYDRDDNRRELAELMPVFKAEGKLRLALDELEKEAKG